jgi:hypothetical protein
MNQGYLLADANSLAYAHRTGGTQLLDIYYDLASKEHRLLAITTTVRDEIEAAHRGPALLKYIADKHISRSSLRLKLNEACAQAPPAKTPANIR